MRREPTDTERMLSLLQEAGPRGVHTHDLRKGGISGNPSQRAADLEELGHTIHRKRENRGKRPGARYTLEAESSGAMPSVGTPLPPHPAQKGGAARLNRELVWSWIDGERRSWIRTDCPREGKLPHVDSLMQQELLA